jgi:mRNA interferase MazF
MNETESLQPVKVKLEVKKYEIWMATMREGKGSEQVGIRPVVVLQNNVGNRFSPTILAAPLTSSIAKTKIPTHVMVQATNMGLEKDSTVLLEQVVTLDKTRLKYKICELNEREKINVDVALMISFGLQ